MSGDITIVDSNKSTVITSEQLLIFGPCPYCKSAITTKIRGRKVLYWCNECRKIEGVFDRDDPKGEIRYQKELDEQADEKD